ncbi:hypothetical protein BGZ83_009012 [Gryganskiella cystojenkinii]|nr:hypothetical protein BGZ83_009012 [Gryganskiella cystojenkinii]
MSLVGQPHVHHSRQHQHHLSNGVIVPHSPTKSFRPERRPSFSITLPPSRSRSSQLGSATAGKTSTTLNSLTGRDEDGESTTGFEEALQEADNEALRSLEPPVRRKSIQFIPGE